MLFGFKITPPFFLKITKKIINCALTPHCDSGRAQKRTWASQQPAGGVQRNSQEGAVWGAGDAKTPRVEELQRKISEQNKSFQVIVICLANGRPELKCWQRRRGSWGDAPENGGTGGGQIGIEKEKDCVEVVNVENLATKSLRPSSRTLKPLLGFKNCYAEKQPHIRGLVFTYSPPICIVDDPG